MIGPKRIKALRERNASEQKAIENYPEELDTLRKQLSEATEIIQNLVDTGNLLAMRIGLTPKEIAGYINPVLDQAYKFKERHRRTWPA
jgi:hypothetical protein